MNNIEKAVRDVARALSPAERPLDAQIARNIILYTHEARDAKLIWHEAEYQPLTSNPFVAWKYCNLMHRLLRDAHPQAVQDSLQEYERLQCKCTQWMQLAHNYAGIAHCITHYMLLLLQKMQLNANYPHLNGRLELTGEEKTDANTCFQLCLELFDFLESMLRLQQAILLELQQNHVKLTTDQGKCRLIALITIAQEYEDVYVCVLKYMRILCCELEPDDVLGLRNRFELLFTQLQLAFEDLHCISYIMDIVKLPVLPAFPPSFYKNAWHAEQEPIPSAPLINDFE